MRDQIIKILQERVSNAFNDCGNSYPVIDGDEENIRQIAEELMGAYTKTFLVDIDSVIKSSPPSAEGAEHKHDEYIACKDCKAIITIDDSIFFWDTGARRCAKCANRYNTMKKQPTAVEFNEKVIEVEKYIDTEINRRVAERLREELIKYEDFAGCKYSTRKELEEFVDEYLKSREK